jgi:hypothetical protein
MRSETRNRRGTVAGTPLANGPTRAYDTSDDPVSPIALKIQPRVNPAGELNAFVNKISRIYSYSVDVARGVHADDGRLLRIVQPVHCSLACRAQSQSAGDLISELRRTCPEWTRAQLSKSVPGSGLGFAQNR